MINRDKVILMTKAAMEDKRDRKRKRPAISYFAEDYVGLQVFKGAIGSTILFAMALLGYAAATAETWMTWTISELFDTGFRLIVLYIFVLLATIVILILVYSLRYYQAKTWMKTEEFYLKKISRGYEAEDRDLRDRGE